MVDPPDPSDEPPRIIRPDQAQIEAATQELTDELWLRGSLNYKRHATQRKIKEAIDLSTHQSHFLLCSRRLGKTYELVLQAFETCIQKPGSRVLFLAPWAKNASEISEDTAVQIMADCPKAVEPEFKSQIKEFHFPNGSIIRVKGVNGEHAQYLRGGAADLVILDEIGLMNDLRHVISDVVMPMTMTTNGRILLATTPPRSPGHESKAIFDEHADQEATSLFTIRDAPHVKYRQKLRYLVAAGEKTERVEAVLKGELAPESTTARREYFCEFVTDADTAVFKEFPDAKPHIVKVVDRPPYFDAYVAMDPGFNDLTGVIYGYVDFQQKRLVIEDESLLRRAATPDIAEEVKGKELANWGHQKPVMRVCDVDLRLIADLWQLHGLNFVKAEKVDSEGGINLVRTMIGRRQILINPKCTNLIRQLENCVYDSKGKDFERTEEDSHFDLAAALKYLCRAINWNRNPFPDWWNRPGPGIWTPPKSRKTLSTGILGDTPFARRVVRGVCPKCGRKRPFCWCR